MKLNHLLKKCALAAAVCTGVICLSVPAPAETYTADNGVLSIDLPSESWKVVEDPTKWIVLSDGANTLTIEHYANGEKLPDITVADDHYVNVFQAAYSTQNEVFLITGSVVDASKTSEITTSILSAKVLKYDTKTAVKTGGSEPPATGQITITPMDKTMYVTGDYLYIRSGCSTDDSVLGGAVTGDAVKITGSVQRDGKDTGWYQIAFGNGTGFVSSQFLSDTPPAGASAGSTAAPAASGSAPQRTGTVTTVYAMSGTPVTIYLCTDGQWYDANNVKYTWETTDRLTSAGGDSFTTSNPGTGGSDLVQCEYCHQWFHAGNDYRNHVFAAHTGVDDDDSEDMIQCEYCGQWFEPGTDYRNHVLAVHTNVDDDDDDVDDGIDDGYDDGDDDEDDE